MAGAGAATPSFKQCRRERLCDVAARGRASRERTMTETSKPRARCAVIDIGSNTTRLLVAEADPRRPGGLVEVAAHRAFVRLTAAERRTGIPETKAQAIAEAVAEQALTARANDIAALRVVATAALRDAPGREALLARLSAAAGGPVEGLSGEGGGRAGGGPGGRGGGAPALRGRAGGPGGRRRRRGAAGHRRRRRRRLDRAG